MDETELISTLQERLKFNISQPVRVKGFENERPVPVVIIDDWNTQDMNFNNSAFAGDAMVEVRGSTEYEKYLNFSFKTRIDLVIRHNDEVKVSKLKEKVKHELRLIRQFPQRFHDGLKSCSIGSGGSPRTEFTESNEHELVTTARFHGDHTVTITPEKSNDSVLEEVADTFTFNP